MSYGPWRSGAFADANRVHVASTPGGPKLTLVTGRIDWDPATGGPSSIRKVVDADPTRIEIVIFNPTSQTVYVSHNENLSREGGAFPIPPNRKFRTTSNQAIFALNWQFGTSIHFAAECFTG